MEVIIYEPNEKENGKRKKVDNPDIKPDSVTGNPQMTEEIANWLASMLEKQVKSLTLAMEESVKSVTSMMEEKAKMMEEKISLLTKSVESLQKELIEMKSKPPSKVTEDVLKSSMKPNVQVPTTLEEEEYKEVKKKSKSTAKSVQVPKASSQPTKTLKSFLEKAPPDEEVLKTLLRTPKIPEERSSNIISIYLKVPFSNKVMQEPILAWKEFLKRTVGELPLSISIINPWTAELFYEENSLHKVVPILKAKNYLILENSVKEKDLVRRTEAYLRGYFRPLRRAALNGLNWELQKKLLTMAKDRLEKRFDNKFSRQQWRHHIQIDMESVLEAESAQMSDL
jgi:hypothetical protein